MACSRRRRRREDGAVEPEVATGPRLGSRRFFKIVLSDTLASGKLGIPKSFLRRCGKDLSNSVLLKVPGGSTWTIELEKCNNGMVLLWKGWREFMEHFSISHGHLIVFKYKGNSTFRVIIFNKSASEIDYSSSSGKTSYLGSELSSPKTEDVIETEDLEDVTPRRRMRIEPNLPYSQLSSSYSPRGSEVPIDTDPEEPHLSQAQAGLTDGIKQPTCRVSHSELVFHGPALPRPLTTPGLARKIDSEHPFFKKVIRRSYMSKLSIPSGFIKQHIQEKQRATLRCANRSWSVRLVRSNRLVRGALHLFFSAGWPAFARETHLRVGNVCVFELIDRDDIVFKVSILSVQRRNELSKRRVNHYEPVFCGPTSPKPLTTPELASEFESEHPFFKVVIHQCHSQVWFVHTCTNVQYVPGQFVKQHIQENKEMATLRFSDRSWPVKLLRYSHENRLFFSSGWPAFARETHLCVGNICVFELIDRDDVVFQVSIFSIAGGIEKSTRRASRSELDFYGPTLSRPLTSAELVSDIDSEHPFFKLVIPQSYINCLAVPVGFAEQHLLENKQMVTLRYSDRSWPVKLIRSHEQARGTPSLSFSAGWHAFARETNLPAGNVCLFELIDRDDAVFKVSILSGAGHDPIHVHRDERQKYYLRPLQHRHDSRVPNNASFH
ncbi:B3 domain-containing protein Os03g0620400-like [Syzygium oleosum]|uniref:B3 domain-containing protein Os03g0620400-like n=1 Tax=Syzygium oleosum TaxID=219896 RepID=UPI0024B9F916|nr:B3 domain-containing protein Os03g0620400-like [Syzygium oleosum]